MPLPRNIPTVPLRAVVVVLYLLVWTWATVQFVGGESTIVESEMWWASGPGGAVILWRGLTPTPPPPDGGGGGE